MKNMIRVEDDAMILPDVQVGKPSVRIVLNVIQDEIIDCDAIQQSASYNKWGCMI